MIEVNEKITWEKAVELYHGKSLVADVRSRKWVDNCHLPDDMTVIFVAENVDDLNELCVIEEKSDTHSVIYMPNTPLYSGPSTYDEKHGPLLISLEGNL